MLNVKKDSCLAWMVCLGAFLAQVATVGIKDSFGIVIGSLTELLDSNTSKISWISSVHASIMHLSSFVASILLKKFGFRIVIIIGALLCITSYLVSAFLRNYAGIIILYGVIGGAGSGMLYTAANIACLFYFDKWKGVSTGLSMSGTGFGTMGVSLLGNYMNIRYGCKGYFIVICLIAALTMLFALFAAPITNQNEEDDTKEAQNEPENKTWTHDLEDILQECTIKKETESEEGYQMRNEECKNKRIQTQTRKTLSTLDSELQDKKIPNVSSDSDILGLNSDEHKPEVHSSSIAAPDRRRSSIVYGPNLACYMESMESRRKSSVAIASHITVLEENKIESEGSYQITNEKDNNKEVKNQHKKMISTVDAELHDKNIPLPSNDRDFIGFNYDEKNPKIFVSSMAKPARRRSSIAYGPKLETYIDSRRKSSIALVAHITALEEYKKEQEPDAETSCQTRNVLILLKDKRMFLYCLAQVMYTLAYYVPMIYLPEMMTKDHGISKEWAGTILSVLGFGNMAGAILTGLIVQYTTISPIILSAASFGILGIGCVGFTFCYTYEHFIIVAVAYGPMLAANRVLIPLIVIEIFGEEKSKDAFGLVMIGKMLAAILGPPIGGYLKEWSATYKVPFYAAGTFHLIGSFLIILMCLSHVNVKVFPVKARYEVSKA